MVETEVEYIFQNNQLVHVMQKVYLYYMTLMLFISDITKMETMFNHCQIFSLEHIWLNWTILWNSISSSCSTTE